MGIETALQQGMQTPIILLRHLLWIALLLIAFVLPAEAETTARLLKTERGLLSAHADIELNGRVYRTDEHGQTTNQLLWSKLSDADRMRLARGYSYMQNEIRDHFGSEGQEAINSFVNQQTGWSDLVTAMKDRHAEKAYPLLEAAFGDGVVVEFPTYGAACWSVQTSTEYLDAVRLEQEIRADFAVGQAVYKMLRDANWDQVSVAVKGISGPLLKIIVDNFICGIITGGASKSSELLVALNNFREEVRNTITQQLDPRQAEPTAVELIEKLDQFMAEMEVTGNTAASLVARKLDELRGLADTIAAMNADCLAEQREKAATERKELEDRIKVLPVALPTPPGDPESLWEEIVQSYNKLRTELYDELIRLKGIRDSVPSVTLDEGLVHFLDGFTSGFDGDYRALRTEVAEIDQWQFSPIPGSTEALDLLDEVVEGARQAINGALPRIDDLEAKGMALDVYETELGFRPSEYFQTWGLRGGVELSGFIDLIATVDRTTESVLEGIQGMEDFSADQAAKIATGREQRLGWLREQKTTYESLRFNFEASLSQHIASLRQLDRLHEGNPYYELSATWTVSGVTLHRYRVNRTYIWNQINAIADPAAQLAARQTAIRRLVELHAEETALLKRLDIARSFHEHDRQELVDFFTYLRRSYGFADFEGADQRVIDDFQTAIGATIQLPDDLAAPLIDYPTDYINVLGNWMRTASDMYVPIHAYDPYTLTPSIIDQLAGKTDSYYELLALYDQMRLEQSSLLALPTDQFNVYYNSTMTRIGELQDLMTDEGISGPGTPARNLEFATYTRLGNLLNFYHGEPPAQEEFASVSGSVTTLQGVGVSGVSFLLTPGTYSPRLAVSGPDGQFLFEHVAPGSIDIRPAAEQGFSFTPASHTTTMGTSALTFRFAAAPNAATGFCLKGAVTDKDGRGLGGINVVAQSEADAGVFHMTQTGSDGSFLIGWLPAGWWRVEPQAQGFAFTPASRRVAITTACVINQNFREVCTNPDDADTDDDGIRDIDEDTNRNGIMDSGETDPCKPDTDGDGIQDGTETGVATAVPDPDGNSGPLLGTDTTKFQPDLDPTTTTDPLDADTDGDGVTDGDEDLNGNGRLDAEETDPNERDVNAMPWIPLLLLD
jgi:hypothetical protein